MNIKINNFQYRIPSVTELNSFFVRNNIPLNTSYKKLSEEQVNFIFMNAHSISRIFAAFILMSIITADKKGIQTHFSSYEEVQECYACFLIGYTNKQSN